MLSVWHSLKINPTILHQPNTILGFIMCRTVNIIIKSKGSICIWFILQLLFLNELKVGFNMQTSSGEV